MNELNQTERIAKLKVFLSACEKGLKEDPDNVVLTVLCRDAKKTLQALEDGKSIPTIDVKEWLETASETEEPGG